MSDCTTGKICYPTRREARAAYKHYGRGAGGNQPAGKFHCYQCAVCSWFHTSRMSKVRYRQMVRAWAREQERRKG